MVIFDAVASKAHNTKDLGFLMDVRRACGAFSQARQIFWMIPGMMNGPLNSPFAKKKQVGNQERLVPKPKKHNCSSVGLHPISGRTFQKDVPVVANVPADLEERANETATAGSASDGREASSRVTPGNVEWAAGWAAGSEGQGASSVGNLGGVRQEGGAW